MTRPLTVLSVASCSSGESDRHIERSSTDVTMISAKRPETKLEVILGVDTHLDFHVAVAVDHLGREA
jgi:hypothetical protein